MNLISSTFLAALLSTFIAHVATADSDVSTIEQAHQKIISAFSTRKSQSFGRHLVTDQCLDYQYEIDMTDINEQVMVLDEDFMGDCNIELQSSGLYLECDYGIYDPIIDVMECSDVGGDVLLFDFEMECDGIHAQYYNVPQCIHSTCDAREYADFMAQDMDETEWEEYGLRQCRVDFTFVDYVVDYDMYFEYDDEYDRDEDFEDYSEYDDDNNREGEDFEDDKYVYEEEDYEDGEYIYDDDYEDDEVEYQEDDDFEVPNWEDDNLLVATATSPKAVEGDSSSATSLFGDNSIGICKVVMWGTYVMVNLLL